MTTPTKSETTMVNLTIDGHKISVPKGTTVYAAATQLGIDLPIFCYMDRMPPFGACRVCLVEVEKMPKLQTSCTLEATEGMVVHTRSRPAEEGRERILEFLLINHPLDCPICDKGGECPLQDQTVKFGPGKSRFYEEKRRFKKPLPLGPVLMLDRERCILCARCTRFGDLVAGDHALELIDRGYRSEVGTPNGGPAESKFIGNTIMICPVGALTSDVYRFRARPWDNDSTETTCSLCPVGCSMILDARDGEVMRTRSCENRAVNDVWLCDKGWFGYEFSTHQERLQTPLIRRSGQLQPASWDEALDLVAEQLSSTQQIAGWGGNPLTFEESYLFQKLIRDVCQSPHVDHRIGTPIFSIEEEGSHLGMENEIGECENLTHVVLFGLDITEEFPVVWLRLKQAINRGAKVLFFGHFAPEVAQYFDTAIVHEPGRELEILQKYHSEIESYLQMPKSALFVGRQYLANKNRMAIMSALSQLKAKHPQSYFNVMEATENSLGARLAGMRPDSGPLGQPVRQAGLNALQVLKQAATTKWDLLYVAGANPAAKFPSSAWNEARKNIGFLIVQDLFLTKTAQQADVVLPTLCFMEKGGLFINIERRLQKLQPGKAIPQNLLRDQEIFTLLAKRLNQELHFDPAFTQLFGKKRLPMPNSSIGQPRVDQQNNSGLKGTFASVLFDHGARMRRNSHLVQLAQPPYVRLNPNEAAKRGVQDGSKVKLRAQGKQIEAEVRFDKSVANNTIVLPLGYPELPVQDLSENMLNGFEIELTHA